MMTKPPPDERPSAQQLMAQSNGIDPRVCPQCGCRHWKVQNTYDLKSGHVRRIKICAGCGQQKTKTLELVEREGFRIVSIPEEEIEDAA